MDAHHRLEVRQQSRCLVRLVYQLTNLLPTPERYVASSQLRGAAWTVHNNIAEGNAKPGRGEMRRFFDTAVGSLAEIDAMTTTLGDLYPLDHQLVTDIRELRRSVNAGIFSMLRTRRR
jgi:four helix bundle protein